MTRVEVNSPSRVFHIKVINKTLAEGVHHTLVLPRVDLDRVKILEHVFHVVS